MTLDERRIVVAVLLSLTLVVRLLAQHHAGGVLRDQSDGLARENRWVAASMRLTALGAFVAMLAWVATGATLPGTFELPGWAYWAGVVLAEGGAVLLIWVQLALGVHLSGTLHLRDDHRLVQHGPYARVRHPMYTAFVLLFSGLSLLIGSAPLAVAMLATQVWTIGLRLPAEERSLQERFGDAWTRYRARTGTVTPWF